MGFRFRRSIKILPGLRLNIGKRGISTSIGGGGAHVTFGKRGTRTTLSIPGTGLSYTTTSRKTHGEAPGAAPPPADQSNGSVFKLLAVLALLAFVADLIHRAMSQ